MREYSTSESYSGKVVAGDHQLLRAVTVASGQVLSAGAVLAEVAGKVQALGLEQAAAAEVLAAGDGAAKVFTGLLAQGGVTPGTVAVSATIGSASKVLTDDGRGRLSGEGVGTGSLDYGSGCYRLEFDAAPDNAADITADYKHDAGGAALAAAVLLEDIDASAGDEPGSALAHGEAVADALVWPDGVGDDQKARALNQLASAGVYVK